MTRPARFATMITVLMVTVLIAGFGATQTFSTFSGSVLDATNRVIPGVTLVLVNVQSGAKYEVRTDSTGRFEFVGLPPGDYTYKAGLPGFATLNSKVAVGGGSSNAPAGASRANIDDIRRQQNARPCAAGPVGGTIRAPRKLGDVAPRYPDQLNAAKVGRVVILNAVIDARGDVSDVSVLRSPNPDLEFAAIEAVRQWQYTPTVLNCVPVEVRINVTVAFVSQP